MRSVFGRVSYLVFNGSFNTNRLYHAIQCSEDKIKKQKQTHEIDAASHEAYYFC